MINYIIFCRANNLKPCLFSSLLKYRNNENYKKHNRQKQPDKKGGK